MADRRPVLRTIWRTAVQGRCPECGQTSMFSGWIELHERCAQCGLRYQSAPGEWIGALAVGYGVGAIAAILLAFVEVAYRPIREIGLSPAWVIVIFGLAVTVIGYRWAKAAWFALLYVWDFMALGDQPPGPPPVERAR